MKRSMIALTAVAALLGAVAVADNAIATGGVAGKVALRGDAKDMKVVEMRVVRRNDVLVVQADLQNNSSYDRQIFYRFRWLDNTGNQVGDGETYKQLGFMGQQMQTIKAVAPHPNATDFRLEMNVETK
ncbi:YcfL family protein [Chitinimonas sp.]|uniref:YcfL family protein n=1 Tax=Chitinimonas sp. TaxID=1934313 RepID=UPI0035B0DADF